MERPADISEKELLTKLGHAIYLHSKFAADAKAAKEAVEYLKKEGAFRGNGHKCTK